MSTSIGGYPTASSSVREWSTPERRNVVGGPPTDGETNFISRTATGEQHRTNVRMVTPMYKSGVENEAHALGHLPDSRTGMSYSTQTTLDATSSIGAPDYKLEREQEHYRLKIIDPKVTSISADSTDYRRRNRTMDFPSEHSHRSFTKLDPLRPLQIQKIRSEDIKPIGDYLSESLERHRLMQQSQLSNKLQHEDSYNISQLRQEVEAWSADKDREYQIISTDDNRIDLAKILTPSKRDLKEGRYEPKSKLPGESVMAPPLKESEWEQLDRNFQKSRSVSNLHNTNTWQYAGDFSPRSVISVNAEQNRTWETDPSFVEKVVSTVQTQSTGQQQFQPQVLPPQIQPLILVPINQLNTNVHEEVTTSNTSRFQSLPDLTDADSGHGTLIRIKDESSRRPRSIIKSERREESRALVPLTRASPRVGPPAIIHHYPGAMIPYEGTKESTQTTEETKRTEEVERTVRERKKEKKEKKKKKRGKSSDHRRHRSLNYRSSGNYDDLALPPANGHSSYSSWNTRAISAGSGGHSPYVSDGYHRQSTMRRDNESGRQAKLSDDRYHDDGYLNGENEHKSSRHHRSRHRMHKSHSSRDVYHNDQPLEEYSDYSSPRVSRQPIVEYPPTLPRGGNAGSYAGQYSSTGGIHKSRSFADWGDDSGQMRYGSHREDDKRLRRYNNNWPAGQSHERDYRSDLLMPVPAGGQHQDQREYKENVYHNHSSSGTRLGDSHFNDGKHGLNNKKEKTSRRR